MYFIIVIQFCVLRMRAWNKLIWQRRHFADDTIQWRRLFVLVFRVGEILPRFAMTDLTVKSLKEFAFAASFKDVIYDLLRTRRRLPNGRFAKRRKVDKRLSSNRAVVDNVRAKLNEYLVTNFRFFLSKDITTFHFFTTGWTWLRSIQAENAWNVSWTCTR